VGSFPRGASPYGVMDMAGNVWEWILDWYDNDYYQRSPVSNPQQTSSGSYRVSRGGGWDCHPWLLRTTGRAGGVPSRGNDALGFRVAVIPNENQQQLHETNH
jgi:formylglycine-generating enzyme required for sulfatase activity